MHHTLLGKSVAMRPSRATGGSSAFRARTLHAAEISAREIQAWSELEANALQPNAYMSPHFVLPALRHLDPSLQADIMLVEKTGAGARQLVAMAVVCRTAATRLLPVPQLSIYQSRHSYLGTPLLARDCAAQCADALLHEFFKRRWSAAGLTLPNIDPQGAVATAFDEALQGHGLKLHATRGCQRASMNPRAAGPEALKRRLGKKSSDIERKRRRLAELGELEWIAHRDAVDGAVVESFLQLEHNGWKAEAQTSLRSNPADESFFREMVAGFAVRGNALFTELRLNGQPVASTCNFVSAGEGFAFKLGWDQSYRKYGVGILNEVELLRQAPAICGDLVAFDSGAAPDSFIEALWPLRRTLATAFVPFSSVGQTAWTAMQCLRAVRNTARSPGPSHSDGTPDAA